MTKSVKGTRVPKGVFGGRDLPHLKGGESGSRGKMGERFGIENIHGVSKKNDSLGLRNGGKILSRDDRV